MADPKKVYMGYTLEELEAAVDTRTEVPDWLEMYAEVQKIGADARAAHPPTTYSYGSSEDALIDVNAVDVQHGAPALIFFHGGGWRLGTREDMAFMAPMLNGAGIAYLSPEYPLAPQFPMAKMLPACRDAILWVHRNAEKLGIDRNRIFVGGVSAGAHIAAYLLSLNWSDFGLARSPFAGGVLMSGYYFDLTPMKMLRTFDYIGLSDSDVMEFSPINHIARMSAPLLVIWAERDPPMIRQQSEELLAKAKTIGLPAERYVIHGKHHFNFGFALTDASSDLSQKTIGFIRDPSSS